MSVQTVYFELALHLKENSPLTPFTHTYSLSLYMSSPMMKIQSPVIENYRILPSVLILCLNAAWKLAQVQSFSRNIVLCAKYAGLGQPFQRLTLSPALLTIKPEGTVGKYSVTRLLLKYSIFKYFKLTCI